MSKPKPRESRFPKDPPPLGEGTVYLGGARRIPPKPPRDEAWIETYNIGGCAPKEKK